MITRGCCTRPNKKDQSYLANVSRPPEYASTTFLTSDIGTAFVQTNLYIFRFPSCNFMIAVSIIQALGKCVKSVLHIAAI